LFRYVLFSVVGGAVAIAFGVSVLWRPVARRYAAAALLAWLPVGLLLHVRGLETYGPTKQMIGFADDTTKALGLDVVFDSSLDYLQAYYYADPAARLHMFHLMDAEGQLRFNDDDTMARAFAGLGQFTDIQVFDRRAFVRAHPRFAVVSSVRFKAGWILPTLLSDERATVTLVREEKPFTAYLVTCPDAATAMAR